MYTVTDAIRIDSQLYNANIFVEIAPIMCVFNVVPESPGLLTWLNLCVYMYVLLTYTLFVAHI